MNEYSYKEVKMYYYIAIDKNCCNELLGLKLSRDSEIDQLLDWDNNLIVSSKLDRDTLLEKIMSYLGNGHNHSVSLIDTVEHDYFLRGLTCANCTEKIKKATLNIDGVKSVNYNFGTEAYTVYSVPNLEEDVLTSGIVKAVDDYEPGVIVESSGAAEEISYEVEDEGLGFEFYGGVIFGIIALILNYVGNLDSRLLLAVDIAAYLVVGKDVILTSIKNIRKGEIFDENFLMTIASIGAFVVGEYPEGIAVMLFYRIGEALEDKVVGTSRKSISALLQIKPEFANVLTDSGEVKKKPEDVKVGEIILIRPGEKIPLDGVVVEGLSHINTSNVTGESVPVRVGVDSDVISGCVNEEGLLKVRVEKPYQEGTIAKILDLVQNAGAKKAPVEKFITKFAKIYTPIVVGIAAIMAVAMPLITGDDYYPWIYRACIFLVISCPCALVISVPLGIFGGIGAASREGIFVKGGNYLENLGNIKNLVMDKTGTLTKGVFTVEEIKSYGDFSEEEILEYISLAESMSIHPIAKAIVNYYGKNITKDRVKNYREISGHGVTCEVDGKKIHAGNALLMNEIEIEVETLKKTHVFLAVDGVLQGVVVLSDILKPGINTVIEKIKALGIKTIILSGDRNEVVEEVVESTGVDFGYGELLPQDKVEKVEEIMKNGLTAFVGDGVNDAPVIIRSDIGISMGKMGSDSAIESSDIVLMNDDMENILKGIKISRRTGKIVRQNIALALGVKLLILILAVLGYSSMWAAVFADVGVTIIAVINSMRALKLDE